MDSKVAKAIIFGVALVLLVLIVWYAVDVFLIAFASILLAILLHAIGTGTKILTRLPYPLALITAIACIVALLTLTFWLYSPLIVEQSKLLMNQLPNAISNLRSDLVPYFGSEILSADTLHKEFSLTNEKFFNRVVTVFSVTVGSMVSFLLFLIVGIYLALSPKRYVQWILYLVSSKKQAKVWEVMEKIGQSLRWWLLGKMLSMAVIGTLTFIGLWILDVSLAFILGILAALLAFIPYVGAILAAVPAILIAFTQSNMLAVYVTLLYVVIHIVEGYLITPFIEQRTVSIPPALTIMIQVLLLILIGALGLALATPLTVVAIALAHYSLFISSSAKNTPT